MNSSGDGFVPPKQKAVKRLTLPRGRFTIPRKNDASMFRECSSINRAFSSRGKLTLPNEKVVGKVSIPRKKTIKPIFPREKAKGRFPRGGFRDRVVSLSKRRFLHED